MSQEGAQTQRNLWVENLFRPLVIGVMIGCVAWSLAQLVLTIVPAWNPTFLVAGCMLAAWEAYYSYRLLRTSRMLGASELKFRAVELLFIFILFKVSYYINHGPARLMSDIRAWPGDVALVLDLETFLAFVLALFCWSAATQTTKDLQHIDTHPKRRVDHISPVKRLTNRFFTGGVVMLIASGLARMGKASELLNLRRPAVRGLLVNVLIYFVLGIVMLGQARFAELRRRWQGQEVHVTEELAGRWVRYSLAFVGVAALLAFLLPTAFAAGLLTLGSAALGVIGAVSSYVALLVLGLFMLLVAWLFWLLASLLGIGESQPVPRPQLPAFEPPQAPGGTEAMGWLEISITLIFSALLLVGVLYVIRSYLRDRPELRRALATFKPLQAVRSGWSALWRWLRSWLARLGRRVRGRLPRVLSQVSSRDSTALTRRWRFFRLGRLSPRERVLYYYLSIVRRAGQQGYPRQHYQTPGEYRATLEPELPQAHEEMSALTHAFVEARYSKREIVPDQEQTVRTQWEQVKAALRMLKHRRDTKG
jgi:hypothetical protein